MGAALLDQIGAWFERTGQRVEKLTPFFLRAVSGSMRVAILLTAHKVDDGQDACGVEDGDADEPAELIVARA